ncbi:hypothetical protein D9M68_445630 [compost metagenome]
MLQGDLVGVFPEGTTTDGTSVLPFHANLMQAPISGGVPVQPVGLTYLDTATGEPTLAPAYIGDLTLLQCLNAILRAGPITARLVLAPALQSMTANRRELAETARDIVVQHIHGACHHVEAATDELSAGKKHELQQTGI